MAITTRRVQSVGPGTLTIASGGTTSGSVTIDDLEGYASVAIFAPAALTGAVTIQVADSDPAGAPNWRTLQLASGPAPADVAIAAGKCVVIDRAMIGFPFYGLRLVSGAAEAADRNFTLLGYLPGN